MSSDPYRLEALLAVREGIVEAAKQELVARLSSLRQADIEAEALKRSLQTRCEERRAFEDRCSLRTGDVAADGFQTDERYLDRLRANEAEGAISLAAAAERIDEARRKVEQARGRLAVADRQREAMAQDRERWRRGRVRTREAAAERELDDVGQAVHRRRARLSAAALPNRGSSSRSGSGSSG